MRIADVTGGAVVANTSGVVAGDPIYAASDVTGGASVLDTTLATNQAAQANGASVDRSREMPDDPLPYSLTGSNSTLAH